MDGLVAGTAELPRDRGALPEALDIGIEGMTCGSCAGRVERGVAGEAEGRTRLLGSRRMLPAAGLLDPLVAGGAMALSSVSVVGSALLLRRWRPKAGPGTRVRAGT